MFPDEISIIWKPSPGDYSERVIKRYEDKLPIRFVIQLKGGFIDALNLAVKLSSGNLTIFIDIDDDAIAHSQWIERYVKFFNEYPNAGGVLGLTLKAYYKNGDVKLTNQVDWIVSAPPLIRSRAPLEVYKIYVVWILRSGFVGLNKELITSRSCIILSASLKGANMAWRTKLIRKCPLSVLSIGSKKGYGNELILSYWVKKNSDTTLISLIDPSISPIAWHIKHEEPPTYHRGFKDEFWFHFDRIMTYWCIRVIGAEESLRDYLTDA